MGSRDTHTAIADLTDEGAFEDLALSVLRIVHPLFGSVVQTGLNAAGRTHRSPLDAIGFVPGARPDHLVAVHHTITAATGLRRKWLSSVSDPVGDVAKTIQIAQKERERAPDLKATLILTTTQEPSQDLVRDARAMGRESDLEVEIWPCSALAHVLDTTADGQTVRRRIFGTPQDRLSRDLLAQIGHATMTAAMPADDPSVWIDRTDLVVHAGRPLTFLVGSSGSGKTVVCLQALRAHLRGGGFGLVLDAAALSAATSLEEAVSTTLKRYAPNLADGRSVFEFGTDASPVLVVVDDINRSGDGPRLAARLAGWFESSADRPYRHCRVLCPVWPQLLLGLDENTRPIIDRRAVELPGMSASEATEVVSRRAGSAGRAITSLQASEVADALGCDPLLMALHHPGEDASPERVIGAFVERTLQRAAGATATSLRAALDRLAMRLLERRNLDPDWSIIETWDLEDRHLDALQALLHERTIISLQGPSTSARLAFRHDRVREHLVVRAAILLEAENRLGDDLVADPALAEVVGGALVEVVDASSLLDRARTLSPLALADAYRRVAGRGDLREREVVTQLDRWIGDGSAAQALPALKWGMTEKFALADGPDVIRLVNAMGPLDLWRALARFRNGDLEAGVYLCAKIDPGRRATWAHRCIAHAHARHGAALLGRLGRVLVDEASSEETNSGALRLAGHLADPTLLPRIVEAWDKGTHCTNNLGEYVWAATRCVGADLSVLDRFYDRWGALSDKPIEPHRSSPRYSLGEYTLKWGFVSQPPIEAMPYLVNALVREDLGDHVLQILECIDHPVGLSAVAEAWAAKQRDREPRKMSFGAFWRHLRWERQRPDTERMSAASRDALARLWSDERSDDALALASFTLWQATHAPGDLATLSSGPTRTILADPILRARLERGDTSAIPEQITRIRTAEHSDYWWQFGRSVWSPELTALLDEVLSDGVLRHDKDGNQWLEGEWIQSELIMRLDAHIAEPLLVRHWDHLQHGPSFVHAALFHATPITLELAAQAIRESTNAKRLLRFTMMHFKSPSGGRNGFVRQAQVLGLEPYFQFFEPSEVAAVGEACNAAGWFDLRRRVVDPTGLSGKACLSIEALIGRFETMAIDKHRPYIVDLEVRRILETGWTWSGVFAAAGSWASSRADEASAVLLADLVSEAGRREDLMTLQGYLGRSVAADRAIANAGFVVRRRSFS